MKGSELSPAVLNAATLEHEIDWFNRVLEAAIKLYFEQDREHDDIREISPPDLVQDESEYARLVKRHAMDFNERIVLVLAMIPHVRPQMLDLLFIRNKNLDRGYAEFGGWQGKYHGGFLPTGETAAFILTCQDLVRRFEVIRLLDSDHFFAGSAILKIVRQTEDEPFLSGALMLSADTLSRCTSGVSHKPDYSITFPAKLITTKLGWEDLVLAPEVLAEIDVLKTWMWHSNTIMQVNTRLLN